jgi:di/tricarboxylate transporter
MNAALIFAIICGLFVTVVLGLVVWLIITNIRESSRNSYDNFFEAGNKKENNKD